MSKYIVLSAFLIFSAFSCKRVPVKNKNPEEKIIEVDNENFSSEYLVMSTLWYQKSAEMRAISYQNFKFAKLVFEKKLSENKSNKPKAIIVDIDETMLDNSPFEAQLIKTNGKYSKDKWREWCNLKIAKALPGAVSFTNFVKSKGVDVFYISNRYDDLLEVSMENMQALNFPFIDKNHFLLKKEISSKTLRREKIAADFEILMLLGDNLDDFSEIFEHRKDNFGKNLVDENKQLFGDKYFIFPNPMYGSWEKAIYGGSMKISAAKKDSLRKSSLVDY